MEEYIKKYCKKHEVSEETAKTHAIVEEVKIYYEDSAGRVKKEVNIQAVSGGDCK